MKLSTNRKDKLMAMPLVESVITKSKDGLWLIHKTIITDFKRVGYYEKVLSRTAVGEEGSPSKPSKKEIMMLPSEFTDGTKVNKLKIEAVKPGIENGGITMLSKEVFLVRSDSDPSKRYEVIINKHFQKCSCPFYKHRGWDDCKHIHKIKGLFIL